MDIHTLTANTSFPCELIPHEQPIRTASEGARVFGINRAQTAPILIIFTDKGFHSVVIRGNRRLDFEKIKELLQCQEARMASSEEVIAVTGYEPGALPLAGLPLPMIVDRGLLSYPAIYGGTGQLTLTLKLAPQALFELNQVVAVID